MTITTFGAARHITPAVIATFFKHYLRQARKSPKDRRLEATDEFLFDEAFNIVRRFISLGTNDTVEALQSFTNTRIPSQPWATVVQTIIPLESCHKAAQALIKYFGEEDLKNVVGGTVWWQVRGLEGIEAEWVAMTNDWKKAKIVEELPDGEARARAWKYAKYNDRHERYREKREERRRKLSRAKGRTREKTTSYHGLKADLDETDAIPKPDSQRRRAVSTPAATTEAGQNGLASSSASTQDAPMEAVEEEEAADEEEADAAGQDIREDNVPLEELDRLRRVMLYCHGGGYMFGSINTHRYQIVRLARKMGGRAFCPNYRKAPQYPWPCPLQDCLAAYFYLTDPPPGAKHKAVEPKNIVIAGDSAGGGLCLAVLGVLRDLGLQMPAGAVLISPWCDMTHSFESILQNTDTDIIPPYGFIFKPSTLWPVPANATTTSNADEKMRHVPRGQDENPAGDVATHSSRDSAPATSGKPGTQQDHQGRKQKSKEQRDGLGKADVPPAPQPLTSEVVMVPLSEKPDDPVELKQQIQLYATNDQLYHPLCSPVFQGSLGGFPPLYILAGDSEVLRDEVVMLAHRAARPMEYQLPEHLLSKNARARETAERFNSQPTKVHLQVFDYQCHVLTLFSFTTAARYAFRAIASFCKYATNAETKTFSPFPKLGLEPSQSSSVISPGPADARDPEDGNTNHEGGQNLTDEPVSLQKQASIGQVSTEAMNLKVDTTGIPKKSSKGNISSAVERTDSPQPASGLSSKDASQSKGLTGSSEAAGGDSADGSANGSQVAGSSSLTPAVTNASAKSSSVGSGLLAATVAAGRKASLSLSSVTANHNNSSDNTGSNGGSGLGLSSGSKPSSVREAERERQKSLLEEKRRKVTLGVENDYSGQVPLIRPEYKEHMIRERVDVRGSVRPLEAETSLQAVNMWTNHIDRVGIIKEGPVKRYLEGQGIWDKRYARTARKVERRRKENERRYTELLKKAMEAGVVLSEENFLDEQQQAYSHAGGSQDDTATPDSRHFVRYGPLDVCYAGETPPPSAVAGRRDCDDSLLLLKNWLHAQARRHPTSLVSSTSEHVGSSNSKSGSKRKHAHRTTKAKGKEKERTLDAKKVVDGIVSAVGAEVGAEAAEGSKAPTPATPGTPAANGDDGDDATAGAQGGVHQSQRPRHSRQHSRTHRRSPRHHRQQGGGAAHHSIFSSLSMKKRHEEEDAAALDSDTSSSSHSDTDDESDGDGDDEEEGAGDGASGRRPRDYGQNQSTDLSAEVQREPKGGSGMHGLTLWMKGMGIMSKKTRKEAYFEDAGDGDEDGNGDEDEGEGEDEREGEDEGEAYRGAEDTDRVGTSTEKQEAQT